MGAPVEGGELQVISGPYSDVRGRNGAGEPSSRQVLLVKSSVRVTPRISVADPPLTSSLVLLPLREGLYS